jgi:hypothetical protein
MSLQFPTNTGASPGVFGTPGAFGSAAAPAPSFGNASAPSFGQSAAPASFGQSPAPAPAFGSNATFGQAAASAPSFGSAPAFGAASAPSFGQAAAPAPAFGSASVPSFGQSPAPAFGTQQNAAQNLYSGIGTTGTGNTFGPSGGGLLNLSKPKPTSDTQYNDLSTEQKDNINDIYKNFKNVISIELKKISSDTDKKHTGKLLFNFNYNYNYNYNYTYTYTYTYSVCVM